MIKFICEKLIKGYNDKNLELPNFSIVTNGTNINDNFINIINKYKIKTVISLDYDEKINEFLNYISFEDNEKIIRENLAKLNRKIKEMN